MYVAGGKVFEAFHAEELMHMVSGMQDFNFKDLESITEYQNGYHAEHPVIKLFWEVKTKKIRFCIGSMQPASFLSVFKRFTTIDIEQVTFIYMIGQIQDSIMSTVCLLSGDEFLCFRCFMRWISKRRKSS